MPWLEVEGPGLRRRIELTQGEITIGRADTADISVRDETLSRRHALLTLNDEDMAVVEDLGSRNGTLVNGELIIAPTELRSGDVVLLGDVYITYRAEASDNMQQTYAADPTVHRSVSLNNATQQWQSGAHEMRLQILLRVTEELVRPAPTRQMFERVTELAISLIDADRLTLLVVDTHGRLEPVASHRRTGPAQARPWSRQIVAAARKTRRALRFDDVRADDRLDPRASTRNDGIRSALAAPLIFDDEVLGVVYADQVRLMRPFTSAEVDLLAAFASQAAIAISNDRLRQQVEADAVMRRSMLEHFSPRIAERILSS
ncbi:MAG: GAF domain-containing protein, partial [Myxococcota bacterium]